MKNVLKIILTIFILAVIVLLLLFSFDTFGCINNWSELGDLATMIMAILLLISIVFLIINWRSMKEQNTVLQKQAEDQKRSTDAAVFKTVIDILQAQEIREARRWVYENLKDKTEPSKWNKKDIAEAEKVCHTFEVVATLANNKLLPESLLKIWGDTMMRSWAYVKELVETYRCDRGWIGLWKNFEVFATTYAVEQKKDLMALKQEEITPIIVRRAVEVANCLKRMGRSDEAKEITIKYGIEFNKFEETTT